MFKTLATLILSLLLVISCNTERERSQISTIFTSLPPSTTGINFNNKITENDTMNYFNYSSIYMGGGVAVGDINNDGLVDLYFSGNQVSNRLYLNLGNLKFKDITETAGVAGDNRWYTGVSMIDINSDGYLDLYCAVAGISGTKENEVYINQGDTTFVERGKELGINDMGNSTQATFFDYDQDGDLDLYLATYPIADVSTPIVAYKQRMANPNSKTSDKLYRNDGEVFIDVTLESGLLNYGFALSATAADLNNDGLQDLYVSNDYSTPDYLYLNQGNGTFKETVRQATSQTSFYGMGVDIADINNDGLLDIFQVDMDSEDNRRQKANMASMNTSLFNEMILSGFHYQYMQNSLQLNSGHQENGVPKFSNISRLAGVSSTDWSWGPLLADFDNDGRKDLIVTNGTRKEVNNRDFFVEMRKKKYENLTKVEKSALLPSEKIANLVYKNLGNLQFKKSNTTWGIDYKGFSNGLAYADLDNDGDLEIITNNIDDNASIFNNLSSESNNYLKIKFRGSKYNPNAIGTRISLVSNGNKQMQELTCTRGFLSSVAPVMHFGLGGSKNIDELRVTWPDGKTQTLINQPVNSTLILDYVNADTVSESKEHTNAKALFSTDLTGAFSNFKHLENYYDDFSTQVLLPHKMSTLGPFIATGDLNNDSLTDYFIGGSSNYPGAIFIQSKDGFIKQDSPFLNKDKSYEDMGAAIFDADGDGDNDLYVASGGYEFTPNSKYLFDRLYINDGEGNFEKSTTSIPDISISSSKVYAEDFDKDGKKDLLILGRQSPGNYPMPVSSYILKNKSTKNSIHFEDVTSQWTKDLENLGMATSAVLTDFDKDGWTDFIIVGEWMPIRCFRNNKIGFIEVSQQMGLDNKTTTGWWWSIKQGDFDKDGDMDYILGNNGLNYKYKADENETFNIFVDDFDNNNNKDIVLSSYNNGKQVPVRGRECSSQQVPAIKQKFKDYKSFSEASLVDIYTEKSLSNALHYEISSFASIYLENDNGKFIINRLPIEAQFSSINQIIVDDFDGDNNLDAVVAGNLYNSEVETPRNDASYGLYLHGDGTGNFTPQTILQSGLYLNGDVKDLVKISYKTSKYIVASKNNDSLQFIKIN